LNKVMIIIALVLGIILTGMIVFFGQRLLSMVSLPEGVKFSPSKDDQVHLVIERPEIPENLTVANKSNIRLKILAYNEDDEARMIPLKEWTLNPGESTRHPRKNYRFKAFKPAIFDKLLAESGVIGSDVTFSGGEGKIEISGSPKKRVSFTNKTKENLRVFIYKNEDTAQLIPLTTFSVTPENAVEWTDKPVTPPMFSLKVFRPQLLDKQLAAQSGVPDQSKILIYPGNK